MHSFYINIFFHFQLCLPKGLVFQKHYSKPGFHPFIITREDGSRVYAGTFTFFELIEDDAICSAMQTLQTMYDAESSNLKLKHNDISSILSYSNSQSASSTMDSTSRLNNRSMSNAINHHRSSSASLPASANDKLPLNGKNRNVLSRKAIENNTPTSTKMQLLTFESRKHIKHDENLGFHVANNPINSSFHSVRTKFDSVLKNSTYDNLDFSLNSNLNVSHGEYMNSSYPCSPAHATHYNMFRDKLFSSKCICLISQYPFNKSFQKILTTLFDMVEQTDLLGINLESHLYNIIYELPMPLSGRLIKFHVGCRACVAHMPNYATGNDLPLFDYDLFDFFRLLGVNNIINFYIAALLEHQILLYSKDYYLLMLVAESLTTLFFPFTWLKPYVPIVPASNLHFIEAPVPYIMGFHHRDIDKEFFKQGLF